MTFAYIGSFLVMTLLVVGVAMPTPGAIGGFHAMYQIAVSTFFGVPTDRAVGGAIVLHAISFVPVTLLGLTFMAREGLSLTRMREMAAEETEDGRRTREDEGQPPASDPSTGSGSSRAASRGEGRSSSDARGVVREIEAPRKSPQGDPNAAALGPEAARPFDKITVAASPAEGRARSGVGKSKGSHRAE
jgi:hypothetical protein